MNIIFSHNKNVPDQTWNDRPLTGLHSNSRIRIILWFTGSWNNEILYWHECGHSNFTMSWSTSTVDSPNYFWSIIFTFEHASIFSMICNIPYPIFTDWHAKFIHLCVKICCGHEQADTWRQRFSEMKSMIPKLMCFHLLWFYKRSMFQILCSSTKFFTLEESWSWNVKL